MTGTLAVLSQALHCLVDETNVLLIDVEAQQAQSSGGTATDTVQELQCLTHKVVIVLVILVTQKVLKFKIKHRHYSFWEVLLQHLWQMRPKLVPKEPGLMEGFPQAIKKIWSFSGSRDTDIWELKGKTVVRFNLRLFYVQNSHKITPCLCKKQKHFVILIICVAWQEVNQYLVCKVGQDGGHTHSRTQIQTQPTFI